MKTPYKPVDEVYEIVEDTPDGPVALCWFRNENEARKWVHKLNRQYAPRQFYIALEDLFYVSSPRGKQNPK